MSGGIASPPRGVWQYQTSDSGRWLALFTLATFGRYGCQTMSAPRFETRGTIAERCGQAVGTVKSQVRKLVADGALTRVGRALAIEVESEPWPDGERPPASPPPDLLALDVPSRVKRLIVGAWSFADYDHDGPEAIVHPTIAQLAERTGQTERAVRDQIALGADLGIVERVPGGLRVSMVIAEKLPAHECTNQPQESPTKPHLSPAAGVTQPAAPITPPAAGVHLNQPQESPHNLQDLAINLHHGEVSEPADPKIMPLFAGASAAIADEIDIERMGNAPIAAQVRALHGEWNAKRAEAAKAHGKRSRDLTLSTKRARDIRTAINDHGFDRALAALRFRASGWVRSLRDYETYSVHMWSEKGVAAALSTMANKRHGGSRGGAVESPGIGARARLLALRGGSS